MKENLQYKLGLISRPKLSLLLPVKSYQNKLLESEIERHNVFAILFCTHMNSKRPVFFTFR